MKLIPEFKTASSASASENRKAMGGAGLEFVAYNLFSGPRNDVSVSCQLAMRWADTTLNPALSHDSRKETVCRHFSFASEDRSCW